MKKTQLAVFVLLAFAAGFVVGRPLASEHRVPVLVAAEDLPPWTMLSQPETQLMSMPFLAGNLPRGAVSNIEDVRGKLLVRPLDKGTPCDFRDLRDNIALMIPEGKLAMTFSANSARAMAGMLLPGSKIDLILTTKDEGSPKKVTSKTFLENILVLSVNTRLLTVAVTPAEAEKLAAGLQQGEIYWALRRQDK
jgi:pilus assembly protein CpaB